VGCSIFFYKSAATSGDLGECLGLDMANLTIFISKIGEKESLKLTKFSCFKKRNSEKKFPMLRSFATKKKTLKS
jgi:hypothetical protein